VGVGETEKPAYSS